MSLAAAANVQSLALPPIVDHDPNSNLSQMARNAKKLEVQSKTDSHFDTNLARDGSRVRYDTDTLKENFSASMDEYPDKTLPLLITSVILTGVLLYGFSSRKK